MSSVRFVCLDWGGTLMSEQGPPDLPMWQWPEVGAVEGAREMLSALAPSFTLCVATNASVSRRAEIEAALARAGLREFVTHVFCYTEIGARKSSRAFWDAVVRTLGCRTEEIAMLGDSLEQDVLGPLSHGVRAVWFNPRSLPVPPGIASVTRLQDFVAWVRSTA